MKKIILLTVLSLLALPLRGQENISFNLTFNHIALSVVDVNRSATFYGDILNFQEITNRSKMAGIRWFSMGTGKELHLISTIKEKVSVNKAIHIALMTPDFDSFVKMLDKMKIVYSDWPGTQNKINIRADGIKQIFFQDPDGYWVEVNSVIEN